MKVKQAWFVGVHGEVKRMPHLEGKELSLKEMYGFIGNDCSIIEHVGLGKGVDMWTDEEGLLKADPILNEKASQMYRAAYPHIHPNELGIVGNVIITDNTKKGTYMEKWV